MNNIEPRTGHEHGQPLRTSASPREEILANESPVLQFPKGMPKGQLGL